MLVAGGHANVGAALAFCTAVSLTLNRMLVLATILIKVLLNPGQTKYMMTYSAWTQLQTGLKVTLNLKIL